LALTGYILGHQKTKVQNDQIDHSVTPSRDKEEGQKISTTRIEVKTKSGFVAILEYEGSIFSWRAKGSKF